MDFFNRIGKVALGSRLRILTDMVTEDAARIYLSYGIDMQPKWFPVFYILSQGEAKTITAIAKEIGHSHPSVSKIVREMVKFGYVKEKKDKTDGRKNLVTLANKGKEIMLRIQDQYVDVNKAIDDLTRSTRNNLWEAIAEWEFLLSEKSLWQRVLEQKKQRESSFVTIVDYNSTYKEVFKRLNEQWITQYFKMEEADRQALDDPEGYILHSGGFILVALYQNKPVGVCALIKMEDPRYDFELAKMAVSSDVQGKGIAWLLGQAAIKKVKEVGGSKIYLESNTILKPAIGLYKKLGFQKVAGHATPYERCNIQMELLID